MNAKHRKFVQEYLIDLNATQAAIRAGYSAKGARVQGHRLLTDVAIASAVQAGRARLGMKAEVTAERIVQEYARLAFGDARQVMSWGPDGVKLRPSSELTDDDAAMVAEVSETTTKDGGSLRLKVHDKKGALDSLSRHLGMFVDRHEHSGKDGTPLIPLEALREMLRASHK